MRRIREWVKKYFGGVDVKNQKDHRLHAFQFSIKRTQTCSFDESYGSCCVLEKQIKPSCIDHQLSHRMAQKQQEKTTIDQTKFITLVFSVN